MTRGKNTKLKADWPVVIITDDGVIEAQSVNITAAGLFIFCGSRLHKNRTYQMILKTPKKQIMIRGELAYHARDSSSSCQAFYFMKITEDDRPLLNDLISAYLE